jgi:hypothetical protein
MAQLEHVIVEDPEPRTRMVANPGESPNDRPRTPLVVLFGNSTDD